MKIYIERNIDKRRDKKKDRKINKKIKEMKVIEMKDMKRERENIF